MKRIPKPRNVRRPRLSFYHTLSVPSIYVERLGGLEDAKKTYAWLGRVIKYLEQEADEAFPPKT